MIQIIYTHKNLNNQFAHNIIEVEKIIKEKNVSKIELDIDNDSFKILFNDDSYIEGESTEVINYNFNGGIKF